MIQILHISNTDIDFDARIRKELRALSHMPRVRVAVVGIPDSNEDGEVELDGARYTKIQLAGRMLKMFPRAVRYSIELIEFTAKAVKVGRRLKPDIVHCHDTFALPAGWLLKLVLRCRLIYDAHELESKKNGQTPVLSIATFITERFCWKRVDLLVSVSDSIIKWYMENLGTKPNLLVLNSPAIAEDANSNYNPQGPKCYFHQKYSIPAGHLVFVYVGILGEGRGIEICLNAFAAGPKEAHVVFIGFGCFEQKIIDFGRHHTNVHFHEVVPHEQVVPLIRHADYGLCLIENVSLSDYYCLPNKLFEYCFAGLPVLASAFPEIQKLVEQYSLGVCCDPDPESIRISLARLVEQRPSYTIADVSELSWGTQADRLRAVYRNEYSNCADALALR